MPVFTIPLTTLASSRLRCYAFGLCQRAVAVPRSERALPGLLLHLLRIDVELFHVLLDHRSFGVADIPLAVVHFLAQLVGYYAKRGLVAGEVRAGESLRAVAVIDQADSTQIFQGDDEPRVKVRTIGRLERVVEGQIERIDDAGRRVLRHPLLGIGGGGQSRTDPVDQTGTRAIERVFEVWIRLPQDVQVRCTLNDPEVKEQAVQFGTTRSAMAVSHWRAHLEGAIAVIGNAPTALFALLEMIDQGGPMPAAVFAFPVGFVGAEESKAELIANPRGLNIVTLKGRRGGSAIAAAAFNAVLVGARDK